jgi:hypothetical protein
MVKRVQTPAELLVEPGKLDRTRVVMLFQQPERFPDYFTCGVVSARFHFGAHEFLKLAGKRNVHGLCSYSATLALITKIVNPWHPWHPWHSEQLEGALRMFTIVGVTFLVVVQIEPTPD